MFSFKSDHFWWEQKDVTQFACTSIDSAQLPTNSKKRRAVMNMKECEYIYKTKNTMMIQPWLYSPPPPPPKNHLQTKGYYVLRRNEERQENPETINHNQILTPSLNINIHHIPYKKVHRKNCHFLKIFNNRRKTNSDRELKHFCWKSHFIFVSLMVI